MNSSQLISTSLESSVRAIWDKVLQMETFDPSASFFELGGDSLAALQMVEAIRHELGRSIDIGTLFRCPTLKQFVDRLEQGTDESHAPVLRRFFCVNESQDKRPLFCIAHAPFIDDQRPIYTYSGLYDRIHAIDDLLQSEEIEAVIRDCLDDILQVQPSGPYYLSGYCHGGWLMVAIAQRLRQRGEGIGYLGLLETFPRSEWFTGPGVRMISPHGLRQFLSERIYGLASAGYRNQRGFYAAAAAIAKALPRCGWTFRQRVAHFHNVRTYRRFERSVFEAGLDLPLHLFVTEAVLETKQHAEQVRRWQQASSGDVYVHPIPADHHTIRNRDNLQVIAEHMGRIVDELERRSRTAGLASPSAPPIEGRFQLTPTSELFTAILANRHLIYRDAETGDRCTAAEMIDRYRTTRQEAKRLAFVYMNNSLPSIAALWGFLFHGYAVVLLNHKLNPEVKATLEERYQPVVIHDLARMCPPQYETWRLGEKTSCFRKLRSDRREFPISDQVDVLLTTSGTTGSPKFVKLSQANLLQNARSIAAYLPIRADDVAPLNLPIDYSYGLSILTSNSIQGGEIWTSIRNVMDPEFWNDFDRHGMTTVAGTPDFYYIARKVGFLERNLPSLRYFTQAGGAMDADSVRQLAGWATSRGRQFFVMYGQTEATARMSYLPPELAADCAGSIGRPIPGGEFEIDGENGELLYRGANIFGGYAESISDLASYNAPALLRTGDIARRDAQGLYYITGRLKRFVKVLGSRVSLDEIEQVLAAEFPPVRFACLRGEGEQIRIVQESASSDDLAIRDFLHRRLRIPAAAFELASASHLPMTANGKTDYQALYTQTNRSTNP